MGETRVKDMDQRRLFTIGHEPFSLMLRPIHNRYSVLIFGSKKCYCDVAE